MTVVRPFFPAPLRPAVAGVALVLALAVIGGCSRSGPPGGGFGFPPVEVNTIAVQTSSFPVAFDYVGQTAGSKEVEVRARVTGILEKRLFREGGSVKSGQELFLIDPKPLEAQAAVAEADLVRAVAQKTQADRESARLKPLAERKAIGQKEADDAASNADFAAASVKAAQARRDEVRLNLGYTRVVAPISGLSSRAPKSEGSLVSANDTLLTTIWQVDPIWVRFSISENDQLRLQRAAAEGRLALPKDGGYEVTIRLSDDSTFPRRGRIDFEDTRVDPATGTFEFRAEIPNADAALKPGQFVRVTLKGAARVNAIALPQTAVLDGPQGKFVFIAAKDKDGKDIAQPRPVVVGDWVDAEGANRWVIESGLAPGDRVIVDGLAKILVGAPIKVAVPGAAPAGPPGATPAGPPGATAPAAKKS